MEQGFTDLLEQLMKDYSSAALTDEKKSPALLEDNAKREPEEGHGLSPEVAAGIANTLSYILSGDTTKTEVETPAVPPPGADGMSGYFKGKVTLGYSNVYEGEFLDGVPHGMGKKTFWDGSVYEGGYKYGELHGKGKFTWADGDVYEGDFVDGTFHGKGKFTSGVNGDVYEGDFVDGKFNGKGKYLFTDGKVYIGDYVDNMRNGKGKMTYPNGEVEEGNWKDGEYVGK